MDIFQKCYEPSLAKELKAAGVYPYFHALQSRQDMEVMMEGKRRIMLGSNNYLGLTTVPDVVGGGHPCPGRSTAPGAAAPGSSTAPFRCIWSWRRNWRKFLRKAGVVTFGTGFQSNVGIISATGGACTTM